jgi:hypothetical protein
MRDAFVISGFAAWLILGLIFITPLKRKLMKVYGFDKPNKFFIQLAKQGNPLAKKVVLRTKTFMCRSFADSRVFNCQIYESLINGNRSKVHGNSPDNTNYFRFGYRCSGPSMKQIFITLYQLHPLLPVAYLILFSFGVLAPGIYCLVRNLPYSLEIIWNNSKQGDLFAQAVITVYSIFALLSFVCLTIVLIK